MKKGIIALDIDGTLTHNAHHFDKEMEAILFELIESQWDVIFLTGRTYTFTQKLLAKLPQNFHLAVQNGAALWDVKQKKLLMRHYLPVGNLQEFRKVFAKRGTGLLIEAGYDRGDVCYYNPEDFSAEERKYLNFREGLAEEAWEKLAIFEAFPFEDFACGKFFAKREVAQEIQEALGGNVLVIRDPFREGYCVAHLNAPLASKAHILSEYCKWRQVEVPYIVAGDDYNDLEMLGLGQHKLTMGHAPEEVKKVADRAYQSHQEMAAEIQRLAQCVG